MNQPALASLCNGQLPSLIMFDLDGTLVDSVPDLTASIDHMLVSAGYQSAGVERVRQWVGNGAPTLVRRAMAWAKGVPDDEITSTLVEMNLEPFLVHYRDHCGDQTTLFPGVAEALELLGRQGITMAVVTNKSAQFIASILEAVGIAHHFKMWIGGDSLDERKPHPMPLQHVMKALSVTPKSALMVGDSRTDIDAARKAGIPCVAVSYGYNYGNPVAAENPDYLVDNLTVLAESLTSAEVA